MQLANNKTARKPVEKKAKTDPKPKKDLTPEEQYQLLVNEATKEDVFKEPIKDLIDQYADLADKQKEIKEALGGGSEKKKAEDKE